MQNKDNIISALSSFETRCFLFREATSRLELKLEIEYPKSTNNLTQFGNNKFSQDISDLKNEVTNNSIKYLNSISFLKYFENSFVELNTDIEAKNNIYNFVLNKLEDISTRINEYRTFAIYKTFDEYLELHSIIHIRYQLLRCEFMYEFEGINELISRIKKICATNHSIINEATNFKSDNLQRNSYNLSLKNNQKDKLETILNNLKVGFIDSATSLPEFKNLFNNQPISKIKKVNWTASLASLGYFLQQFKIPNYKALAPYLFTHNGNDFTYTQIRDNKAISKNDKKQIDALKIGEYYPPKKRN